MVKLSEIKSKTSIPIKNLRLVKALSLCGKGMFDVNGKQNYQESDLKEFSICDDDETKITRIACAEDDLNKAFDIHNPKSRVVVVLPFDHNLITGSKYVVGGVADCGLLSEKEFVFVEFKTNAYTPSLESIKNEYLHAMEQLWHTFEIIRGNCKTENNIDIEFFVDVEFYIVNDKMFEQRVDQMLPVKVSAQQQSYQILFQSEHKGAILFFAYEKEFI